MQISSDLQRSLASHRIVMSEVNSGVMVKIKNLKCPFKFPWVRILMLGTRWKQMLTQVVGNDIIRMRLKYVRKQNIE